MRLFIYLFIFTSLTVDLKLLIYTKTTLCSLYGNNIATSSLSLNRKCNLSQKNFLDQCEKTDRYRHICSHIIKQTFKGTPSFLCSEFSGVHCINPTCCRYILQSRHGHCKGTHFLIFLLKILKDCDNLTSLGTRSHIFGPKNEMDSVRILTEFTLRLCNVSFRRKLYGRETGTNISFKMGGEKLCKTL